MVEKKKLISMVTAVQNGDERATTELYETFQSDIYYFILKTVNNDRELAEDLTQDTFIEILETIHKLEEPAAFVTWSKQIAYHKCTAYFRKRRELLVDENEDGYSVFDTIEEDREEFIPDAALDHEDLRQTIMNIIKELPEEQRSAIILRYFNEISVKEIADIQGVTEGTVKSRLNYGRKAIKQSVEEFEKKNGIKLHCAGVLPLMLWFFKQYRVGKDMSLSNGTASHVFHISEETAAVAAKTAGTAAAGTAAGAAAGTTAAGSAATGVAAATAAVGKLVGTKLVAGVLAAAVAVGGVTIGVTTLAEREEDPVIVAEEITQVTEPAADPTEAVMATEAVTEPLEEECPHLNYYEKPYLEGNAYTGYYALICSDCDALIEDNLYREDYLRANTAGESVCAHHWVTDYKIENGIIEYAFRYCKLCDARKTVEQNCDPHIWDQGKWVCTDKVYEYTYCVVCGYQENLVSQDNLCEHDWNYYTQTTGDYIGDCRKCNLCGAWEPVATQARECDHSWSTRQEYSDGVLIYDIAHCTKCGKEEIIYSYRDNCTHTSWDTYSYTSGDTVYEYRYCLGCGKDELVNSYPVATPPESNEPEEPAPEAPPAAEPEPEVPDAPDNGGGAENPAEPEST